MIAIITKLNAVRISFPNRIYYKINIYLTDKDIPLQGFNMK